MKTFVFFVAVFMMIGGGIWMMTNGGSNGNSQEYYSSTLQGDEPSYTTPKEIEPESWKDSLVGTWQFTTIIDASSEYFIFTGEVEYKKNGNYIRHISLNLSGPALGDRKEKVIVSGGSVTGKWSVNSDDGFWKETISKCNIKTSYTNQYAARKYRGYSTCKRFFGSFNYYGSHNSDMQKLRLKEFKKKYIEMSGKRFDKNGTISTKMYRIE